MDWRPVSEYFKPEEFRCACCLGEQMNETFLERLFQLRKHLAFPFKIRSGYRCPAHNERVSGTGPNGPHTTGRAADIALYGGQAYEVVTLARQFGFTGIGIRGLGPLNRRFVHLDDLHQSDHRRRPTIWTYPGPK